jgi:hypothetical protein
LSRGKEIFENSKNIRKKYDYRKLSFPREPYFDIDFNKVFYLTDTGRRWDGWKTSIRDKVPQQEAWAKHGLVFHSTYYQSRPGRYLTQHNHDHTSSTAVDGQAVAMDEGAGVAGVKNVGKGVLVRMSD